MKKCLISIKINVISDYRLKIVWKGPSSLKKKKMSKVGLEWAPHEWTTFRRTYLPHCYLNVLYPKIKNKKSIHPSSNNHSHFTHLIIKWSPLALKSVHHSHFTYLIIIKWSLKPSWPKISTPHHNHRSTTKVRMQTGQIRAGSLPIPYNPRSGFNTTPVSCYIKIRIRCLVHKSGAIKSYTFETTHTLKYEYNTSCPQGVSVPICMHKKRSPSKAPASHNCHVPGGHSL